MKLDRRHMAVSATLLVGSIIYNVWVFTGSGKTATAVQSAAPVQAPPSAPLASDANAPFDAAQVKALPDVALDRLPEWPRNPFQNVNQAPDVVASTDAAPVVVPDVDPVVGTILYSSDRRAAMIDGHIVRIGDTIPAGKVVDILPKAVIIESPERGRRTFEMKPGSGTGSGPGAKSGTAVGAAKPGAATGVVKPGAATGAAKTGTPPGDAK